MAWENASPALAPHDRELSDFPPDKDGIASCDWGCPLPTQEDSPGGVSALPDPVNAGVGQHHSLWWKHTAQHFSQYQQTHRHGVHSGPEPPKCVRPPTVSRQALPLFQRFPSVQHYPASHPSEDISGGCFHLPAPSAVWPRIPQDHHSGSSICKTSHH